MRIESAVDTVNTIAIGLAAVTAVVLPIELLWLRRGAGSPGPGCGRWSPPGSRRSRRTWPPS